jgi:uncharacterized protein YbjT (DUF2867 family)
MMYAILCRYAIEPGAIDAVTRRLEDEVAPALRRQPGFACHLALGIDDSTIETVSVFDVKASAERAREFVTTYVRENIEELTPQSLTGGPVLVSLAVPEALADAGRDDREGSRAHRSSTADVSARPALVVGATGRTGRLIVKSLREHGLAVKALVRDGAKGREILPAEVPQFVGNARSSHTLIAPMEGIGAVIIATAGGSEPENTAELVDYFGTLNLIRQAVASHVELVIFISTLGATRAAHSMDVEPTSLGWKARAEEIIRSSGVPYCIVRAGWLTDGAGGEPVTVTQGDTTDGRISRVDLAGLCAQLLLHPSARGKTIDVVSTREGSPLSVEAAIAAAAPDMPARSHGAADLTMSP